MTPMRLNRRSLLALAGAAPFATLNRPPSVDPAPTSGAAVRRAELYGLLGRLPDRQRPVGGTKDAQINELIAPRAHLALAGLRDELTPVEGLDRIDRELQQVYADGGVLERWKLLRYDVAHQETAEGRREVLAFLERHL